MLLSGGTFRCSTPGEDDRTRSFRGSKSRNKVSVGEPAEGSLPYRARPLYHLVRYASKTSQKVGLARQLWETWEDRGTSRRWQSGSRPTDQGLVAAASSAATRVERAAERCPSHHRTASVQTTKARLPAGEQTVVLPDRGPRPSLCLAPPALNEFLSADDRPARHYRRRRGGPPGLGRDATTKRLHSISSSTSTRHDGRPARILCGRRRRPLFSSPTPGYVLRAPDRRLPSGASPIFLGLAFDFSHTPFYRKSKNLKPKTI